MNRKSGIYSMNAESAHSELNVSRLDFLQRSLLGEYLAMMLMIHAAFGAAAWALVSLQSPKCIVFDRRRRLDHWSIDGPSARPNIDTDSFCWSCDRVLRDWAN